MLVSECVNGKHVVTPIQTGAMIVADPEHRVYPALCIFKPIDMTQNTDDAPI